MIRNRVIRTGALVITAASILCLALLPNGGARAFSGSGNGTVNDPFLVSTCADLQSIKTDADNGETYQKRYELTGNINCTATSTWNSGDGFEPISNFEGVLDGKDFTIDGLTINRPGSDSIGLFARISSEGLVARIELTNASIVGNNYVGTLTGEMNGTAADIQASGSVTGSSDDYYFGTGGLIGRKGNSDTSITRVSFTGTVTNSGSSTGGLIGFAGNVGVLSDSYANAQVTGTDNVGGLIGYGGACCNTIRNSYAVGDVTGSDSVGGLIGTYRNSNQYDNIIENIFAAASVTGDTNVGAVIGSIYDDNNTAFTGMAFDQDAAGTSTCVGRPNTAVISCTAQNTDGLTPEYLQTSTNAPLSQWNFTSMWQQNSGSYPSLRSIVSLSLPGAVTDVVTSYPDRPDEVRLNYSEPASVGSFPIKRYQSEIKEADKDWSQAFDETYSNNYQMYIGGLKLATSYTVRVRTESAYGAGEWTEYSFTTNPVTTHNISTCQQLQDLQINGTGLDNILLTQDIDCSTIDNFQPLDYEDGYRAIFNGQGYTISNLTIDTESNAGIFTYTDMATIKNLNFDGGSILAQYGYAGAVAGEMERGNMYNVHSNIDVESSEGSYVGGLVGFVENFNQSSDMNLINLSSSGNVGGTDDVGGLFGELENDEGRDILLSHSYATGNVYSTVSEDYYTNFGGLIGDVESLADDDDEDLTITIEDSYATGNVSGTYSSGGLIGDLAADTDGYDNTTSSVIIRRTYAAGDVTSSYGEAGGLIGNLEAMYDEGEVTILENNFAAGNVGAPEGYLAGGLIGNNEEGNCTVSSTSNYYNIGYGLDCTNTSTAPLSDCTSINPAEFPGYFKNNTTNPPLDAWDFDNVWLVQEDGYPILGDMQDLNGDDTPDYLQPQVSGYQSPITGKTVVIDASEGCELNQDDIVRESALSAQDAAYEYANGLFDFEAECSQATTTIKLYYYGVSASDVIVRKFNPNTNAYFTITDATVSQQSINGQSVAVATYQITDGGALDMDGEANGTIVDPAGIATAVLGAPKTGL